MSVMSYNKYHCYLEASPVLPNPIKTSVLTMVLYCVRRVYLNNVWHY
jgi:hypothetical protein